MLSKSTELFEPYLAANAKGNDIRYNSSYLVDYKNWSCSFLERQAQKMDDAISQINQSGTLSQTEKEAVISRLERVKLTPLSMINKNKVNYDISDEIKTSIYNE